MTRDGLKRAQKRFRKAEKGIRVIVGNRTAAGTYSTTAERLSAQPTKTVGPDRPSIKKVTIADVEAAKTRVAIDRSLQLKTPDWIVRLSQVASK